MNELRQLVKRYIAREIDFAMFRRAFAEQFLTTVEADPAVWKSIIAIESACADFSEQQLSEDDLKRNVAMAIQPRRTETRSAELSRVILLSDFDIRVAPLQGNLGFPVAASGTNSNPIPSSSGPSNWPRVDIVNAEPILA